MKILARVEYASTDAKTGDSLLTLRTSDKKLAPMLPYLQEKQLSVNITESKKRSLSANAYAWVLIDKLAAKTKIPKTEIYRNTIRDLGGVSFSGWQNSADVPRLKQFWEYQGTGWMLEEGETQAGMTWVEMYYGSSEYDVHQMSRFLDLLKEECAIQGIQTATPKEVANMLSLWSTA